MAAKNKKKSAAKSKKPVAKGSAKKAAAKRHPAKKLAAKKTMAVKKIAARKPASAAHADFHALITPLDDRLVVVPQDAETMTSGGIIIPNSGSQRPNRGEVVAKGRGRRNKNGQVRPLDVSVGDQVMFAEFSGTKLSVAGQEILILREEDILGIVT